MQAALRILTCWLLLAAAALAGFQKESAEIAPGVKLVGISFGRIEANGVLVPATEIELQDGAMFGWQMKVETTEAEVKVRVVFELPAPPKVWSWEGEEIPGDVSKDGSMRISRDRKTATATVSRPVENGTVSDTWTIADGDPTGEHKMSVYVGEKLVRVFRFKIVPPAK